MASPLGRDQTGTVGMAIEISVRPPPATASNNLCVNNRFAVLAEMGKQQILQTTSLAMAPCTKLKSDLLSVV